MERVRMRIVFVPDYTDVYVSEDGKAWHYEKIVTEQLFEEHDDYIREVSLIPGVSAIRLEAKPDGVSNFFWTYSDDMGKEAVELGVPDGYLLRECSFTIPDDLADGTTLYVEEGNREVDYGYDLRDLYFSNGSGFRSLPRETFRLERKPLGDPFEAEYAKMREQMAGNETELKTIRLLSAGAPLSECESL